MATFRKGKSSTQGSGGFQAVNLILKAGSGFTWINPYLKDGTTTRLRILSSFDPETGEEDLALNPEATSDMDPEKNFEEIFGPLIYKAEVTDGVGTNSASFISGAVEDRDGNSVRDGWSPAKVMLRRLRYKLEEASIMQAAGRQSDIPPSWQPWVRRFGRICKLPSDALLVQCMAYEVGGQVKLNLDTGDKEWVCPAVYAIPRSAQPLFLQDASQRMSPDRDLDLDNNMFGDFSSCEKGKMVLVRKIPASGDSSSNTYNLKLADTYPVEIGTAQNLTRPWEDILNIPTIEDVIENLVKSFDGLAVDYGLRESPVYAQYIPEAYRGSSAHIKDCANLKELRASLSSAEEPDNSVPPAPRQNNAPAASPTPEFRQQAPAQNSVPAEFREDAEGFDNALRKVQNRNSNAGGTMSVDGKEIKY